MTNPTSISSHSSNPKKSTWTIAGVALVSVMTLGVGGYFLADKLYQDKVAKEVERLFDQKEKIAFMDDLFVIDLHKNYQLSPAGWLQSSLAFNVDIGIEGDVKTFPLIADIHKNQISAKLDLSKLDADFLQLIEPYWGKGADPFILTTELESNQYTIALRRSNGFYRLEDGVRVRTGDGSIQFGFEDQTPQKMQTHINLALTNLILEDHLEQVSMEGLSFAIKDKGLRLTDQDKTELLVLFNHDPSAMFLLKQDYFPLVVSEASLLELNINKLDIKTEELSLNLNNFISRFSTTNTPETGLAYELGVGTGFEIDAFEFYNHAKSQLTVTANYLAPLDMAKLMLVDVENLETIESTLTKLAKNIALQLSLEVANKEANQISDAIELKAKGPENTQLSMVNPMLWLMGTELTGKLSVSPNTVRQVNPELAALEGLKNQLPPQSIVQWNEQGYVVTFDKDFMVNMMMGVSQLR